MIHGHQDPPFNPQLAIYVVCGMYKGLHVPLYALHPQARSPDGWLARGPDGWSVGRVTSLDRARVRARARARARASG